jgi:hypothetical protein
LKRHQNGYCDGKSNDNNQVVPDINDTTTESDTNSESGSEHNEIKDESSNGTHQCTHCKKTFTLKHNLKRHIASRCQVKMESEKQVYEKLKSDKQYHKKYIKDIDTMMSKMAFCAPKTQPITVTNNSNNTNTVNSNNTINIQLVAFGKEDKSRLTNREILKILNKGYHSVPELLKAIHFDENKPENHNIYISNDRSSVMHVFDGEKWNVVDRNETIRNLFDDGRNFLLTKAEEFNEREKPLTDRAKKMVLKFERFDHDIDEYPVKKKEILTMIRNMLYNDRDLPMNTRKQLEDHEKAAIVLLEYSD